MQLVLDAAAVVTETLAPAKRSENLDAAQVPYTSKPCMFVCPTTGQVMHRGQDTFESGAGAQFTPLAAHFIPASPEACVVFFFIAREPGVE